MEQNKQEGSELDKLCHKIFEVGMNVELVRCATKIWCSKCGAELESYYCEDRLYLVRCKRCETITLVMAKSPADAAYRARAIPVIPIEQFDDNDFGAFWREVPFEDEPDYVGTISDIDFPEKMEYGFVIPFTGTNGKEYLERKNCGSCKFRLWLHGDDWWHCHNSKSENNNQWVEREESCTEWRKK